MKQGNDKSPVRRLGQAFAEAAVSDRNISPWRCLEEMPTLFGTKDEWRKHTGQAFDAFKMLFLKQAHRSAKFLPCPQDPASKHEVRFNKFTYRGVCKKVEGKRCATTSLTLEEISQSGLALDRESLARAIASAFEVTPYYKELDTHQGIQAGYLASRELQSNIAIFVILPHSSEDFQQVVSELCNGARRNFILVAPTDRFADDWCKDRLEECNARLFRLESEITLNAKGKLEMRKPAWQYMPAKLPDQDLIGEIHREVKAGRSENREGFEKLEGIRSEIAAVRDDHQELRAVKARLEAMQGENLFKFVQKIDGCAFRIVCAVLLHGDVAKAARALDMKDSTLRGQIAAWKTRGRPYLGLLDLVRWRKASRITGTEKFNDALKYDAIEGSSRDTLLTEVLNELMSMTETNWPDVCAELEALLRSHLGQQPP